MNIKFRTYGTRVINKNYSYDLSSQRIERELNRNKPYGCLWASPLNVRGFTWLEFCIREEYNLESLDEYKDFTLSKDAKILSVNNDKDLKLLVCKYGFTKKREFYFNWEKIRKEYDAFYIRISNIDFNLLYKYNLMLWDVDSLCVFNLKKVVV